MSHMGHERRFREVRRVSAYPLTAGRVEMWRGDGRLNISVCRLFRLAVP